MPELRGKVVQEGAVGGHLCGPGWVWCEQRPYDPETMVFPDPPSGWSWCDPRPETGLGTVVECDCGQTWVCAWQEGYDTGRAVVFGRLVWRKETRWQRWRRRRRARRNANV